MSSLIDQGDDSELIPSTQEQIDSWLTNYMTIMGNVPRGEEEPSESQLAALHKRVPTLKGAPYVDFAIWTPCSRKNLKLQKFRMYIPLGDGLFLTSRSRTVSLGQRGHGEQGFRKPSTVLST